LVGAVKALLQTEKGQEFKVKMTAKWRKSENLKI
jgi:hypothetical protein